jgi:hypothetical protein
MASSPRCSSLVHKRLVVAMDLNFLMTDCEARCLNPVSIYVYRGPFVADPWLLFGCMMRRWHATKRACQGPHAFLRVWHF